MWDWHVSLIGLIHLMYKILSQFRNIKYVNELNYKTLVLTLTIIFILFFQLIKSFTIHINFGIIKFWTAWSVNPSRYRPCMNKLSNQMEQIVLPLEVNPLRSLKRLEPKLLGNLLKTFVPALLGLVGAYKAWLVLLG